MIDLTFECLYYFGKRKNIVKVFFFKFLKLIKPEIMTYHDLERYKIMNDELDFESLHQGFLLNLCKFIWSSKLGSFDVIWL